MLYFKIHNDKYFIINCLTEINDSYQTFNKI